MSARSIPACSAWLLLLALSLLSRTGSAALTIPDQPAGRVSDYAGLLREEDRLALEAKLRALEDSTSTQITIAIFSSLEGEILEEFSIRLAEKWQIGQKGKDNGAILSVFVQDRQMRIEVGRGLEGTLTDAISSRIIRNELASRFREGRYAEGLNAAVDAMIAATRGEYRAEPRRERRSPNLGLPLLALLMFLLFGIGQLNSRRNRRQFFSGSSRGWNRGSTGPWLLGGGGFGGGGGWSGGGGESGFSGGGGDFSGGGASGDW